MTKEKPLTEATELGEAELGGAKGGGGVIGGWLGSQSDLGRVQFSARNFRAVSSGPSVPGMNLMEGEEDELQTRPSPDLTTKTVTFGPRVPGIK
ncbi:MAG: hypothetical protein AAGD13_24705 [Pseudomonadota bacterium]